MLATTPSTQIIDQSRFAVDDTAWLAYYDPQAALNSVIDHVDSLTGSQFERHTMRAYLASLSDFCSHLGAHVIYRGHEDYTFIFDRMRMPSRGTVTEYIAGLRRRGLTAKTVTRYMAAVRHFIRALEEQPVYPQSGADFVYILEMQRQFRLAAATKNPKADKSSDLPAVDQTGTRLTIAQVNQLFNAFTESLHRLDAQRDLALLYLGISAGLRAAELARITPASITQGTTCREIRVRGKRNNHDPVGIDDTAYQLIMAYIANWNSQLDDDDPRRITQHTPIFRPVMHNGGIPPLTWRKGDPAAAMAPRAILYAVEKRTLQALGFPITAHDMRRSCAALMRSNGYEWDQIRVQLRHQSIATTENYVGRERDLSKSLLSNRVDFVVPKPPPPAPRLT